MEFFLFGMKFIDTIYQLITIFIPLVFASQKTITNFLLVLSRKSKRSHLIE